jgi:hypothetical protein
MMNIDMMKHCIVLAARILIGLGLTAFGFDSLALWLSSALADLL